MMEWFKSMIEQMEALNAGYMKIGFGEYGTVQMMMNGRWYCD